RPGDGVSLAATQGQDRSSFDTEPGLRSSRFFLCFLQKHICFLVQMCFFVFFRIKKRTIWQKVLVYFR
uniref:hypothetical protein n=1 Tax=Gemmiger formicilis TaxID=745368 RepID=UPI004025EB7A